MKTLAFLILSLLPLTASAGDYMVSSVRTDFTMTDGEPRYRDIYVNMGLTQGIKKGSQLDVFRSLSTIDEVNHRVGKNISFKIAKIKVIHADDDISVARVVSLEGADITPNSPFGNVMVGDRIELGRK